MNRDRQYDDYSITFHSTAIEGSSLTEIEIELLLTKGVIPEKPQEHTLMVKDHHYL